MTLTANRPTEFACLHEAGHAIIAQALGSTVTTVRVDGMAGACDWTPLPWQDEVIVLMAGWLAVSCHVPPGLAQIGSQRDRRQWQYRLRRHGADPATAQALEDRTRALVETHMPAIEALAARLLSAA